MDFFRHRSLRILCALLAFFVLGDIVADGLHDASGACATESQQSGHDECPACTQCTIHNGAAVASEAVAVLTFHAEPNDFAFAMDDRFAPGAPPSIDHPPQLS